MNLVSFKVELGSIFTAETSYSYQVAEPEASVSLFSPENISPFFSLILPPSTNLLIRYLNLLIKFLAHSFPSWNKSCCGERAVTRRRSLWSFGGAAIPRPRQGCALSLPCPRPAGVDASAANRRLFDRLSATDACKT